MIEATQRMISEQDNPAVNNHLKLEIKTLQNAPRKYADIISCKLMYVYFSL
jgi:hypothetical protein